MGTPPAPVPEATSTGTPATSTDTGAPTSTTGTAAGCDCAAGTFCAAPHIGGVSDPDDDRLVFACQAECVPEADASHWCSPDEASCCDGLPCTATGFCGSSGVGTGTPATGGDSGTSSTGASSTGADSSSGSSGSGSGSSGSGSSSTG
jgi:hypothetical protein